jgi:DNA-binding response OmpR family regulator
MLSSAPRVVAVLDSDPDTTELLKTVLEIEGMVVATGSLINFRLGKESLLEFLERASPDVIVYDLGIPYEANYHFLQKAREDPAFPVCALVITTTNARAVQQLLGIEAVEIIGKPYDVDALIRAVRLATADPMSTNVQPDENRREGDRRHAERRSNGNRRSNDPAVH